MGPPPFGDGNWSGRNREGSMDASFNGATAFRRWKPELLRDDRDQFRGFNGATAFRRWKHQSPCRPSTGHRASMGPPPFGDGNHRIVGQRQHAGPASMGPPPFGDGNHATWSRVGLNVGKLQWGHRLSAMETGARTQGPGIHTGGFNGATAFRRWKPRPTSGCGSPSRRFNGATAFRRWKHGLLPGGARSPKTLQWGHRLSAMETTSGFLSVACGT